LEEDGGIFLRAARVAFLQLSRPTNAVMNLHAAPDAPKLGAVLEAASGLSLCGWI
jgi:hypothetical protein